MAGPKVRIMHDILEEHLEEFEFLWGQRQNALRSPLYTMRELADLEERIEAHVQGILVAGDELPALLEPGLTADEPVPAFGAAYVLLRAGTETASRHVLDLFFQAKEAKLDALTQALCHGPWPGSGFWQRAQSCPPAVTVAAAHVLAFKGQADPKATALVPFLKHPEPAMRQAAWRCAVFSPGPFSADTFRAGLNDPDPLVQGEVCWAAAWHGQAWFLEHCRKLASAPGNKLWEPIYLLAVLGKPVDLAAMRNIAKNQELGPRRFMALGAFSHPELMQLIFEGLDSKDLLTAVAAAKAFTKFTGQNIESDKRAAVPPADGHEPDDFEKEFLDEVKQPDLEKARAHWKKEETRFRQGTRWCRGLDLSQGAAPALIQQLDMESRWEACLRGKFEGTWKGNPADLEVFPQKGP